LPIANVVPLAKLVSHFVEVGDFAEAELLVKPDAWIVGKADSGHQQVKLVRVASGDQFGIEPGSQAAALNVGTNVDPDLTSSVVGFARLPSSRFGETDGAAAVIEGGEPRKAARRPAPFVGNLGKVWRVQSKVGDVVQDLPLEDLTNAGKIRFDSWPDKHVPF